MSIGSKHVLHPIKSPRNQKQRKGHITVKALREIVAKDGIVKKDGLKDILEPSEFKDGGLYGNTKVLDISIVCSTFIYWKRVNEAAVKVGYKGVTHASSGLIFRLIRVNIKNWFVVYKIFENGIGIFPTIFEDGTGINHTMLLEILTPPKNYVTSKRNLAPHRIYLACKIISGAKQIYGEEKARKVLKINKNIEDFWTNAFKARVEKHAMYIKLKKVLEKQQ